MPEYVQINLTLKEVETILNALVKFPYNEVSSVVASVGEQTKAYLAAQEALNAAAPEAE